jgi:hypothetical protein
VLVDVYILFIIEIVYAYHLVCSCIVRLHENDQICLFGYIIVSSSSTSQCCQQQPDGDAGPMSSHDNETTG